MKQTFTLALLMALSIPSLAHSCECAGKLDLEGADLVFEGIAGPSEHWFTNSGEERVRHKFWTTRVIKGPKQDEYLIESSLGDCGFPYTVKGAPYVIYASKGRGLGEWFVSACSLTRQLAAKPRKS